MDEIQQIKEQTEIPAGRLNKIYWAQNIYRYRRYESPGYSIKFTFAEKQLYHLGKDYFEVPANAYLVVNPGQQVECHPCPRGIKAVSIFLREDLIADVFNNLTTDELKLLDTPDDYQSETPPLLELVFRHHKSPLIRQLSGLKILFSGIDIEDAGELEDADGFGTDWFYLLAENLIKEQLTNRQQMHRIKVSKQSTGEELYRRLIQAQTYIYDHWELPLKLQEVATAACLSPYHFHRSFRQAFGKTPAMFIREVKAAKAVELLKHHTVTTTAYLLGYSDIHTFSKAFKKETGKPPSQFQSTTR